MLNSNWEFLLANGNLEWEQQKQVETIEDKIQENIWGKVKDKCSLTILREEVSAENCSCFLYGKNTSRLAALTCTSVGCQIVVIHHFQIATLYWRVIAFGNAKHVLSCLLVNQILSCITSECWGGYVVFLAVRNWNLVHQGDWENLFLSESSVLWIGGGRTEPR